MSNDEVVDKFNSEVRAVSGAGEEIEPTLPTKFPRLRRAYRKTNGVTELREPTMQWRLY